MTSAFRFARDGSVPTRRFPSARVAEIPAVRRLDESRSTWSNAFTRMCAEIEIGRASRESSFHPFLPTLFRPCAKWKVLAAIRGLIPLRRSLRKWLWCRWHVLLFLEVVGISVATSPFCSPSARLPKSSPRLYSPWNRVAQFAKYFYTSPWIPLRSSPRSNR